MAFKYDPTLEPIMDEDFQRKYYQQEGKNIGEGVNMESGDLNPGDIPDSILYDDDGLPKYNNPDYHL